METPVINDRIDGVILGTAVGDSIGLPREGVSRKRAKVLFSSSPLKHSFFLGRGMISDDTEHACMVGQALLASKGDVDTFAKSFVWRLKFWLLGVPAGVGLATLRGILKLWLGFSPKSSGVHSAGNGPAMRSGLLGLCTSDKELLEKFLKASTQITHTDIRAYEGALIITLACQYSSARNPEDINIEELFYILDRSITNTELKDALQKVQAALDENMTAEQFADSLGLSKVISGYIVHTVQVSIFCWLNNLDSFQAAVEEVILLGGDSDTTGAITGALAGASLGASKIPQQWLSGIMEWPRSVSWMRALSRKLAEMRQDKGNPKPVALFWPGLILRNLFFTFSVLMHGLRRVFPPY